VSVNKQTMADWPLWRRLVALPALFVGLVAVGIGVIVISIVLPPLAVLAVIFKPGSVSWTKK